MTLSEQDGWTMPAGDPYYPALPARYRNVRMQFVFFRADPGGVEAVLPEPLTPDPGGLCVAAGLAAPDTSNYGAFDETFVMQKCAFRGEIGWYCSHVPHNGPAAIAAGREIYGTPKIFATIDIRQSDGSMVTAARMGGRPVMTITTNMEAACDPGEMPAMAPSWRLKVIPRADGPGPALKQLIDGAKTARDVTIHEMRRGIGTVRFEPNPLCDLTGLQPVEHLDAYYVETDYTEGYAEIVYDYLAASGGAEAD